MIHSPFVKKKKIFGREPPWYEKAWTTFKSGAKEWFIDHMPSEDVKQMPPGFFYPIGVLLFAILIGIYFSIFIPNYNATINTKFLAPNDVDDQDNCHPVTISTTGNFLATIDGEWQGSSAFQYSKAAYQLNLANAQFTQEEYTSMMDSIYTSLYNIGERAKSMDLGQNLLVWMIFATAGFNKESGKFLLTGNPLNVFNRQKTYGCISNVNFDCRSSSDSFFDEANGIMEVNYNYKSYENDANCSSIASPQSFGYTSYANPTNFEISVDVRALIVSISINLNLISIDDIEMVAGTRRKIAYNGINYITAHFYDPQFPNMKPITCFYQNPTSDDYLEDDETIAGYRCLLIVDGIFALPIMNHVGNSTTIPSPCNCSTFTAADQSDPNHICNRFLFITGLLFYNNTDYISPIAELLGKYTYEVLNQHAYYPMYLASMWGHTSPENGAQFQNETYRRDLYDFCNTSYGMCSFVTFSSFDLKNPTWEVSSYYYQVQNGACQDTFTPTDEAWNKLIEMPFAPLVQGYQTCRNNPTVTFFQEAGIAIGNVSIMTPVAVLVVLMITYLFQCCTGRYIPKSYSSSEKTDALDSLAVALLLARDKKLLNEFKRTSTGVTKISMPSNSPSAELISSLSKSLLVSDIVQELETIAQLSEKQYTTETDMMVNWQALWNTFYVKPQSTKDNTAVDDEYGHEMSILETAGSLSNRTSGGSLSSQRRFSVNPMHASGNKSKTKSQLLVLNFQQFHGTHVDMSNELVAWRDDTSVQTLLLGEILRIKASSSFADAIQQEVLSNALSTISDLIESFESLVTASASSTLPAPADASNSNYWSLVPKTAALRQWRITISKERLFSVLRTFIDQKTLSAEMEEDLVNLLALIPLLEKCQRLLMLHAVSYLHCTIDEIQDKHAKKLSYMLVNDVWTLKELTGLLDFVSLVLRNELECGHDNIINVESSLGCDTISER